MDLPEGQENFDRVAEFMKAEGREIFPISAATGEGMPELMERAWKMLAEYVEEPEATEEVVVYEPTPNEEYSIRRDDDGAYVVEGKNLEKLVAMTNFDDDEGLRRFQNIWRKQGIDEALKERGIKEGDTVRIKDMEFEFRP